jgi:hypothetical protein
MMFRSKKGMETKFLLIMIIIFVFVLLLLAWYSDLGDQILNLGKNVFGGLF